MILGSRFVKPLRAKAEATKAYIVNVQDMVDELVKCQRQWLYLRNIFLNSQDIMKALPDEHRKFT